MRTEVSLWWIQSEEDFESAQEIFKIKKYYLTVFLCQQAVEKALKALYIQTKKTSPMTHSLVLLATECEMPNKFFTFLRKLTPQFVNTRYPDAAYGVPSELYDSTIATDYLKQTREVLQWLQSQIKL